jgi:hypothetical protein
MCLNLQEKHFNGVNGALGGFYERRLLADVRGWHDR